MYKKLFWFSSLVWILTIIVFMIFFITGSVSESTDKRLAVNLTPVEKDIVLGEMRQVLKALNGVLRYVGEENFKEASVAAKSAGAGMAVDVNPVLMAKLPIEFKKLGMSMHDDFDQLSKELNQGMGQGASIKRLGEITNKCLACHAAYRLNEVKSAK